MKKFTDKIDEDLDVMRGVENVIKDPFLISLISAWILNGNVKLRDFKSNIEVLKHNFLLYANSMGYTIDHHMLAMIDHSFKDLVHKVKTILKK